MDKQQIPHLIDPASVGLDPAAMPRHVAFIMDGNGRWAQARGKLRTEGHRAGSERFLQTACYGAALGLEAMTFYAFSMENWKRPRREVDFLFGLLQSRLRKELDELAGRNMVIRHLGGRERIAPGVLALFDEAAERTRHNTGTRLSLAVDYSARWELLEAVKRIARESSEGDELDWLDEEAFAGYLTTHGLPDPDLLIRTSAEQRLSNFLLWQLSYSEFVFTDEHWPDFDERVFVRALMEYQRRTRRFGETSEQVGAAAATGKPIGRSR